MIPFQSRYLEVLDGLLRPDFVLLDPSLLRSSQLDFEYCSKRFKSEGIKFLTVELPSLRKAVDRSFETGLLEAPASFGRLGSSALPSFLFSHLISIYEETGVLRFMPDIDAIRHVRQVTECFYKLELPFSKEVERSSAEAFIEREARVSSFVSGKDWYDATSNLLVSGAAMLVRKVFYDFNPWNIIPRHGPGSVATGEKGPDKWKFARLYSSIHQVYPYYKYFYHSTSMLVDSVAEYRALERLSYGHSKVVFVPKDSRGPRTITAEPLEYQYIQQGLGRKLSSWLESHPLTKGHVNFTDQTVNQRLAKRPDAFCTIDMKDASDLLSLKLVERVFRLNLPLLRALLAVRTPETVLPDSRVVPLNKYAGMGSACTFPVEATVFWALCVSSLMNEHDLTQEHAASLVYVFGDDIIVPNEYFETVVHALTSCGLVVNTDKSYHLGDFRESCGVDAFLGVDISVTRIKKLLPSGRSDGTALAAWCSYANVFEHKGYTEVAARIWSWLRKTYGEIPYGVETSSFPCQIVGSRGTAEALNIGSKRFHWRISEDLQRIEFEVRLLVPVKKKTSLDGWRRVTRNFVMGAGDDPSRFSLPREVKLIRGWTAV